MLRIAICDDQPTQLMLICSAAKQYFAEFQKYVAEVYGFQNAMEFLDSLEQTGGYDIAILDICMPGINGVRVGTEIRKRKDPTEIIFLTTSNEFAVEAFALNAVHYLVKPFTQEQFQDAMDRALERFDHKQSQKILLQTENGVIQIIDAGSILYIESLKQHKIVHTMSGFFTETRRTLSAFAQELEELFPGQFISPYRGYIVNLDYIRTITPKGITLQDHTEIPIKSGDFRKLRDVFFTWSFRDKEEA